MLTAPGVSQLARERADQAGWMAGHYEGELRRLKMEEMDIEAKRRAASLSSKRFTSFEPEIDGHLQCPHCWIDEETRSRLNPIPGTAGEDIFRCDECHFEISAPT
jgi:hypothetical protein